MRPHRRPNGILRASNRANSRLAIRGLEQSEASVSQADAASAPKAVAKLELLAVFDAGGGECTSARASAAANNRILAMRLPAVEGGTAHGYSRQTSLSDQAPGRANPAHACCRDLRPTGMDAARTSSAKPAPAFMGDVTGRLCHDGPTQQLGSDGSLTDGVLPAQANTACTRGERILMGRKRFGGRHQPGIGLRSRCGSKGVRTSDFSAKSPN